MTDRSPSPAPLATTAQSPQAIPFTVLGGYLGAGKTTLLNRLLSDNQGVRIALLINDFGAINIDAELIEQQTDQQINLTNGCVCCGLSDGFDDAISTLLASQQPPEHIVVEASGVADVHSLAQYGRAPGLRLDAVVVVADAQSVEAKANDKYVANTVRRQLLAADLVVLNKTDLVTAERLAQLRGWLHEITAGAPLVETSFCDLPQALLLGGTSTSAERSPKALTENSELATATTNAHHHETYATWNYSSDLSLSRQQANELLKELPANLLRGKGFIDTTDGLLEWHRVGRQERLTPVKNHALGVGTQLVAIGLQIDLDCAALDKIAGRYFNRPQSKDIR